MSHAFGGDETLLVAVPTGRNRAAICPNPGCGRPGRSHKLDATIIYFPGGGTALAHIPVALYWCANCGIWFAREEK